MNILFTSVNTARSWANAQGQGDLLKAANLEKNWHNDKAAMRFYTFLERSAGES